jgi:hypothetical protein
MVMFVGLSVDGKSKSQSGLTNWTLTRWRNRHDLDQIHGRLQTSLTTYIMHVHSRALYRIYTNGNYKVDR